jgi:transcriptional regulator with XRE-family HTH domain
MINAHQRLGRMLGTYRRRAGLTLEQLAERAGVSTRAISDCERGVTQAPRQSTVQALCVALSLSSAETELVLGEVGRLRVEAPAAGERSLRTAVPVVVSDFVGRSVEIDAIRSAAADARGPRVVVITGEAGLGKTALALHAATGIAKDFPFGLVFLDFRNPGASSAADASQLAHDALRSIGVAQDHIPAGLEARSELWRQLLAEHRVLVILDNVADVDRVQPMLPAAGPSFVIVTSRNVLIEVAATRVIRLEPLTPQESLDLLAKTGSPPTSDAESSAAGEVAALCDHGPLALRLAGLRMRSRSAWTWSYLAQRLRDSGQRMQVLQGDSLSVDAGLTLSYEQLTRRASKLFSYLVSIPGTTATVELLAAATGMSADDASAAADELAAVGLLTESGTHRLAVHDLSRAFGRQRLVADGGAVGTAEVRSRLTGSILTAAVALGRGCDPSASHPETDAGLSEINASVAWLTQELENWFGAVQWAAEDGDFDSVLVLGESMHWASEYLIFWEGWTEVFALSAQAAAALADDCSEATQLGYLSWAYTWCLPDYARACDAAERARAAADRAGDLVACAWAGLYRTSAERQFGDPMAALSLAKEAALLAQASARPEIVAGALVNLARSYFNVDCLEDAERELGALLQLTRDPGSGLSPAFAAQNEGVAFTGLAALRQARGDLDEAIVSHQRAINAHMRGSRMPAFLVLAHEHLAQTLHTAGRDEEALRALNTAMSLRRASGSLNSDLGHISVNPNGAVCRCGNRGCVASQDRLFHEITLSGSADQPSRRR